MKTRIMVTYVIETEAPQENEGALRRRIVESAEATADRFAGRLIPGMTLISTHRQREETTMNEEHLATQNAWIEARNKRVELEALRAGKAAVVARLNRNAAEAFKSAERFHDAGDDAAARRELKRGLSLAEASKEVELL
jgi:hypothetical protein